MVISRLCGPLQRESKKVDQKAHFNNQSRIGVYLVLRCAAYARGRRWRPWLNKLVPSTPGGLEGHGPSRMAGSSGLGGPKAPQASRTVKKPCGTLSGVSAALRTPSHGRSLEYNSTKTSWANECRSPARLPPASTHPQPHRLLPTRYFAEALHALWQTRLCLPSHSSASPWPLLSVDSQGRRQDRHRSSLSPTGPTL